MRASGALAYFSSRLCSRPSTAPCLVSTSAEIDARKHEVSKASARRSFRQRQLYGLQEIHHHDSEDQHEHRRELCAQARNMSSKLACSPSPVVTTFCSLFAWKVGKLICIRYRYGMSSTRMRCNSAKIVLRSAGSPDARALANSSSTCRFA